MSTPRWLTLLAAGFAGLAMGFFIGRNGGDALAPVSPSAAPMSSSIPASAQAAFTLDDVRRVVREELDARSSGAALTSAHPVGVQETNDPAQSAAASRASSTFESALARRSWTEADSEALRDDFANMAPEQRSEWLRQFSLAVNQGRLVPENERSPF